MTSIAEALEAGSRIGPVVLEAAIDRGGYGIVYRGQHDTLGPVAIKEFFPRMVASRSRSSNQIIHSGSRSDAQAFEKGLQKFLTEAHVLEKLDHPNVVKFHEVIEANGTAYLVMNFVAGKTLGDFIVQNSEEIDDRFSQRVAVDIAGALDALHAEGIIHQDVAPDNIIIEQTTNRPILIDFGGAKQVVHGYTQHSEEALIKRGFSPPEHFPKGDVKGLERGPWSDLYGLSAVLYNLVAAKPPPDSISRVEFDRLIPTKNVGSDRATQALLEAIDWGLKVSPQKRPQTVFEWLEVAEGTSRPSFKIALPKVQIDPKVFAAIAAVLVLAVVGTGIVQLVTALNDNWAFNQAMTGDCVSARSYISKQKERSADPGLLQISQWCDARDQAFVDGSIDSFVEFARDYSPTRIPETARVMLTEQTETALWEVVIKVDSLIGYETYLRVYPGGAHFGQASDRVESLRATVSELQQRLKNIGLYSSAIDGDPGIGTQRAANSFANNKDLEPLDLISASNLQIRSFIQPVVEEEQRLAEERAQEERERLAQEQRLAEERAAAEAERRRAAEEQERRLQALYAKFDWDACTALKKARRDLDDYKNTKQNFSPLVDYWKPYSGNSPEHPDYGGWLKGDYFPEIYKGTWSDAERRVRADPELGYPVSYVRYRGSYFLSRARPPEGYSKTMSYDLHLFWRFSGENEQRRAYSKLASAIRDPNCSGSGWQERSSTDDSKLSLTVVLESPFGEMEIDQRRTYLRLKKGPNAPNSLELSIDFQCIGRRGCRMP